MSAAAGREQFAPALAALLVIALGVPLAATLNIWIDEAYTLHTTGSGVAYALHETSAFELQPPLYFVLIAAWRLIDESSVTFARLPSVAFAAGAAACIVIAARRVAPLAPPIGIAFATALNPIVVWAAVEMRVYPLALLAAAALVLSYLNAFATATPSRAAQITYGIAALVGLYTQYYVAFVMIACGAVILVVRRRALPAFLVVNGAAALLFAPYVPTALYEAHAAVGGDVMHVTLLRALHEMFNANFIYLLPHELAWSGPVKAAGFLAAAALAAALVVFGRPHLDPAARTIGACWIAVSVIYSLVFAVSGEALDVRKHAIAIAPLALLTGYAVVSSVTNRRRELIAASVAVYAAFVIGSLWYLYGPPASKSGDWKRVATLVSATDPPATVVVFPANLVLALGRYLPAQTRVVAFPSPMRFQADYLVTMKLRDEAQVARAFAAHGIAGPIWIVTDNSCDPGPLMYDFACPYLQAYLREHYRPMQRKTFRGSVATFYEPRGGR